MFFLCNFGYFFGKSINFSFCCTFNCYSFFSNFLKEKVGFRRWSAVIIGFIGSLIVIRPGFVEINLASIAALGTGVMYGFYLIITRKLSTSDNPLLTLLLTGVVGAVIISAVNAICMGKPYPKSMVYDGCDFYLPVLGIYF